MFLVWMTNYLVKYPKQAKTLAIMRKSVNVVETVHQMSSDQRFLASVVQDEAPGVPSSLFNDNGEMRENSKAELMNEICATLSDVLTEPAFHFIDGCAWLYCIYWGKVGNIKDLDSSLQKLF